VKKGWKTNTLGEVLAVLRNGINCKQDKSNMGDKISRIESISNASFNLEKVGYARLSKRDKERYRLQPGDILFSHINSAIHVGKTAMFESTEPVYHGVNLLLMRPKELLTSAFLEYNLKFLFQSGYWRNVCKQSVNQASVNQKDISLIDICYPISLPEQHRIVRILDEAFEAIATAKANAEKNLRNAREVAESHLNTVLRSKKWKRETLGDLCDDVEYGSSAKSKAKDGVPVLRMGNIQGGRLDNKAEIKKYLLKHNDVLFNRTNSPELVGKTAIYKSEMPAIFAGYLIRIHRKEDLLDGDYLTYFLNSQIAFDYGKTVVISSVNQANINGTKLKSYPIPAPSLSEQKNIVSELDTILAETQRLARLYERKLTALTALKQSLLHQAFTGEL
jgi:type I restriction enzyme S subunit